MSNNVLIIIGESGTTIKNCTVGPHRANINTLGLGLEDEQRQRCPWPRAERMEDALTVFTRLFRTDISTEEGGARLDTQTRLSTLRLGAF